MKRNYSVLVGVASLLCANVALAQKLQGRLVDGSKSQEGIAVSAQVQLLKEDGRSVLSATASAGGVFVLPLSKVDLSRAYILSIKAQGYQPRQMRLSLSRRDMDLGGIALQPEVQALAEVTVSRERGIRADGYTIFPSRRVQSQSSSGYDFVRKLMLPDVRVDEPTRAISTLSGQKVLVIINDKRSSVDELLTLRTRSVSRVLYIDTPGSEYGDDDYGAVLKIYTHAPESGLSGGINLSNAFTTIAGENFAFLRYNRHLSEVGLTYEQSYVDTKRRSISQEDGYLLDGGAWYRIRKEGEENRLRYHQNKATLHYNLTKSDRTILNVALSGTWYDSPERTSAQLVHEERLAPYRSLSRPTEEYLSPELDVFYRQRLGSKSVLSYNAHGTLIFTDYGYAYREEHPTSGSRAYAYNTEGVKRSIINELRYDYQFGAQQLSLGGRHLFGETKNTYVGSGDVETSLYNQDLYLYAQLAGRWRKVRYNAGLGVNMQSAKQANHSTQTWLLRPRLAVALPLGGWYLQYSFGISPISPSLAMLSDVSQRPNAWEVNQGNPSLEAYSILMNRLSVRRQVAKGLTASLQLGLNYADDPITPIVTRSRSLVQPTFVQSWVNAGSFANSWANLGVQWAVIPEVFNLSGSLVYSHYSTKGQGYSHSLANTYASLQADLSLGQWSVMAGLSSPEKNLREETISRRASNLHLMVRYRLGAWTLGLNATNIFSRYGFRQEEELLNSLHRYYQDLRIPSMSNMVGLTVNWRFASGRKHQAGEQTLRNSDRDAGIVKF